MTGAGRRPNQIDFQERDGHGGPSARPGDQQGSTLWSHTDGPGSVCLGVSEDRPLGRCAPLHGIWNQGPQFKSQLCHFLAVYLGRTALATLGLRFSVCGVGSKAPITKNRWTGTTMLVTAAMSCKLNTYWVHLVPATTRGSGCYLITFFLYTPVTRYYIT